MSKNINEKKIKTLSKNETWIFSDGTKGMENQSVAVAKMLNNNFKLIHYNPPNTKGWDNKIEKKISPDIRPLKFLFII